MTHPVGAILCDVHVKSFDPYAGISVRDFDLTGRATDCIHLVGDNGSGKSTLLRLLALSSRQNAEPIIKMARGTVIPAPLRSLEMNGYPDISYLSQETQENLIAPTCREDIVISLMNQGSSLGGKASEVVQILGLDDAIMRQPLRRLSSGMRQLACVAAASVLSRSVYLFDEPTANLDDTNASKVLDLIRFLCDRGGCVIFASHALGTLRGLSARPYSGWTVFKEGTRAKLVQSLLDAARHGMRELRHAHLEASDITVSFGRRTVLSKCRIVAAAGVIVEATGPNGCGKTTLARVLSGLKRAGSGTVAINGSTVRRLSAYVAYSPQASSHALLGRTVAEDLTLACGRRTAGRIVSRIGSHGAVSCDALSYGERKILSIIGCILSRPVVVLDEPFAGLDAQSRTAVSELLMLGTSLGRSIICMKPSGACMPPGWASEDAGVRWVDGDG